MGIMENLPTEFQLYQASFHRWKLSKTREGALRSRQSIVLFPCRAGDSGVDGGVKSTHEMRLAIRQTWLCITLRTLVVCDAMNGCDRDLFIAMLS